MKTRTDVDCESVSTTVVLVLQGKYSCIAHLDHLDIAFD